MYKTSIIIFSVIMTSCIIAAAVLMPMGIHDTMNMFDGFVAEYSITPEVKTYDKEVKVVDLTESRYLMVVQSDNDTIYTENFTVGTMDTETIEMYEVNTENAADPQSTVKVKSSYGYNYGNGRSWSQDKIKRSIAKSMSNHPNFVLHVPADVTIMVRDVDNMDIHGGFNIIETDPDEARHDQYEQGYNDGMNQSYGEGYDEGYNDAIEGNEYNNYYNEYDEYSAYEAGPQAEAEPSATETAPAAPSDVPVAPTTPATPAAPAAPGVPQAPATPAAPVASDIPVRQTQTNGGYGVAPQLIVV